MTSDKFDYITYTSFTDPGLIRPQNEDSLAALPADGCFLVSDGMGGGSAGEIASRIVAERVADAVVDSARNSPGNRKYAIHQAVIRANREILNYARARDYAQMGSTLVLWLADSWDPRRAWLCHVGDSRVYRMRGGSLAALTRDHTIGAEIAARTADASYAEHSASAISHILTRSIGVTDKVVPEWDPTDVVPGDLFLICSDGVSTMLTDAEIAEILAGENGAPDATAAVLAERVRQAGAHDNFTFIILRIAGKLPKAAPRSDDEKKENAAMLETAEKDREIYRK